MIKIIRANESRSKNPVAFIALTAHVDKEVAHSVPAGRRRLLHPRDSGQHVGQPHARADHELRLLTRNSSPTSSTRSAPVRILVQRGSTTPTSTWTGSQTPIIAARRPMWSSRQAQLLRRRPNSEPGESVSGRRRFACALPRTGSRREGPRGSACTSCPVTARGSRCSPWSWRPEPPRRPRRRSPRPRPRPSRQAGSAIPRRRPRPRARIACSGLDLAARHLVQRASGSPAAAAQASPPGSPCACSAAPMPARPTGRLARPGRFAWRPGRGPSPSAAWPPAATAFSCGCATPAAASPPRRRRSSSRARAAARRHGRCRGGEVREIAPRTSTLVMWMPDDTHVPFSVLDLAPLPGSSPRPPRCAIRSTSRARRAAAIGATGSPSITTCQVSPAPHRPC